MTPNQENSGGVCETPAAEIGVQVQAHGVTVGETRGMELENLHGIPQALQAAQHQRQHPSGGTVANAAPAAQQPAQWQRIPQGLRERAQWCVAGADKRPLTVSGGAASVTDPTTWDSFDAVCAYALDHDLHIGYVLTGDDPYTCIDLDVKETTTPEQLAKFWAIIQHFNSYTEFSRSGKGVHIWVKGTVGPGARSNSGVEAYSQSRFIICTGNPIPGYNKSIEHRQDEIDVMVADIRAGQAAAGAQDTVLDEQDAQLTDDELWSRASTAGNAEKFLALFNVGDWERLGYPSQSEADLSLLSMLCFYSKSNDQCRRVFRYSALGKRLKAVKNDAYLNRTLRIVRGRQNSENEREASIRASSAELVQQSQVTSFAQPSKICAHVEPPQVAASAGEVQNVAEEKYPWPPGFAGHLARFVYHSSYLPVREVAIASTLGLLAGVCGRAFTISGKSTSLYIILVARSAIGKDAMHDAIPKLINMAQVPMAERFINASNFASGPALHKAILKQPGFLNLQGEFGHTLRRMANLRDTPMVELRKVLTDAFAKTKLEGKSYSDSEKTMPGVDWPALSFLGETTPGTFYEALSHDMLADGFMSRFLVITHEGERPSTNEARGLVLEPQALAQWRAIVTRAIPYQQTINMPLPIEVQFSTVDAYDKLKEFEVKCGVAVNASGDDESKRQMWNRAHLKALQIAALLACADNEASPKIDLEHATWAVTIVRNDIEAFSAKLNSGDIGGDDHSRETKLLSLMKSYAKTQPAQSYKIPPAMHQKGLIPRRYFQMNISKVSAFCNHKFGTAVALDLTIRSMIDNGYLVEVAKDKMALEWGAQGKCYYIAHLPT